MIQDDYQYAEMVQELRDAVRLKYLTMTSQIQIVRDKAIKVAGNYPIIDWYYNREGMVKMASGVLDDIEDAATVEIAVESEDSLSRDILYLLQYIEDMPQLETTTVTQVLWELEKTLRS